jgi:uncharacterized protein YjbI with pentapeptide repeats
MTQQVTTLCNDFDKKAHRKNQEAYIQRKIREALQPEARQALKNWFQFKPAIDKARYHALLSEARQTLGDDFSADLSNLDLRGHDLSNMDFAHVNLFNADLCNTNLQNANFKNALLNETKFRKSNMSGCQLEGAIIRRADFTKADIFLIPNYLTILRKAYSAGSVMPNGKNIALDKSRRDFKQ